MGIINQMRKFSLNVAQISKPLRELLSSKTVWMLTAMHSDAFCKLKEEICSSQVLALYDTEATIKVNADASAHGLRTVCYSYNKKS